jgi:hypothetical protein
MDEEARYEERYCAYLDILGFRDLVRSLSTDPAHVQSLRRLLQKVHAPPGAELKPKVRVQSISDAVALSTQLNAAALDAMLQSIAWLMLDLLWEGYFVRGAVVKGPLYHDDHMVFGKALVDAYYYESEVAKYPRVVVVREVREEILKAEMPKAQPELMKLLKQSEDGPMFLDVLRFVRDIGKKAKNPTVRLTEGEQHLHSRFNTIGSRLQERFEQSMDNPRHFEKVRWFAKYWNDAIVLGRLEYRKVLGAGLDAAGKWGA